MTEASERSDGAAPEAAEGGVRIDASLVRGAPGLVRIGIAAWWRTAGWTLSTARRVGSRIVRGAVAGETPAEFFRASGHELRANVRHFLGIGDAGAAAPSEPAPHADAPARDADPDPAPTEDALRERGAELLRSSAAVDSAHGVHPAYAKILDDLTPDEARVLRLLAVEGAQATIDVRTAGIMGVGSDLVAEGFSMIGADAGCLRPEWVPAYLNNLHRLGLVWFSSEPLADHSRYQVLEAQPDVSKAMEDAGRGRTERRSIRLTAFGEDFCETCLPVRADERDPLPGTGEQGPGDPRPDAAARGDGGG